ncbi:MULTISPECIES: polyprenyl diphosphate synthase [unclassified Streptomyces]|uniref:polyprenyl diphosphate synthase n=1 Tax=unclassified Streptomyces TaxID=2593676 RepID=UPI0038068042
MGGIDGGRTTDQGGKTLRASYRTCRRLVRASHPAEYALLQLMPPRLRPAGWALYAAFHTADALSDDPQGTSQTRTAALHAWTTALRTEVEQSMSADPVRRALVDTLLRWDIDLADLELSLTALGRDAAGTRPATWQEWSTRAQAQNTSWIAQGSRLLAQAGTCAPVRLKQLRGFGRFVDGLYLTDTLTDLADDVRRGTVMLPAEVFDAFPGSGPDLLHGHWTPAVQDLIHHLLKRARQRLRTGHDELRTHLQPGAEILTQAGVDFFLARLDAIERAGGQVLRRPARPGPWSRSRILLPARARAFLLWRLVRLPDPPEPVAPSAAAPVPPIPTRPVPPHPSGAQPPHPHPDDLPRHVAVIMDGNGRWATRRGLDRAEGHTAGVEALFDVVYGAVEIGLRHLTVYAFSSENWRRSPNEVSRLSELLRELLADDRWCRHGVRLRWIGEADGLPDDLLAAAHACEAQTRDHTGLTVNVCLNYGGRGELTRAGAALAHAALAGELDPSRLTERDFARFLPHHPLPDVDLLWRTGGERRVSNFLPWHTTYAELHFTDRLWPDVDRRDLWQTITAYGHRARRFGALPAPRTPEKEPHSSAATSGREH